MWRRRRASKMGSWTTMREGYGRFKWGGWFKWRKGKGRERGWVFVTATTRCVSRCRVYRDIPCYPKHEAVIPQDLSWCGGVAHDAIERIVVGWGWFCNANVRTWIYMYIRVTREFREREEYLTWSEREYISCTWM